MFRANTMLLCGFIAALASESFAQTSADPNSAPNPYRLDTNWLKMPDGRKLGQVPASISIPMARACGCLSGAEQETASTLRLIRSRNSTLPETW